MSPRVSDELPEALQADAAGFIDHTGRVVDVTWTDGVTRTKSVFHFPHIFALIEMFKIKGGKIAGVEAVFVDVPADASAKLAPLLHRPAGAEAFDRLDRPVDRLSQVLERHLLRLYPPDE